MKDPIDFHIRSLEQRIDDLTEENEKLKAALKESAELLGTFADEHVSHRIRLRESVRISNELIHSDQPKS